MRIFLILLMLILALPAAAQDNTDLPLLEPGWHLGSTFFGSGGVPDDPALHDAVAQMDAFTFYLDWSDLEPSPGAYDLRELQATLEWLHGLGIQPLLNITLIDIANLSLPDGMALDDPDTLRRLNALLDRVVPLLVDHGGFLLLLGNEVDAYFEDVPSADPDAYAHLIAAARDHVQSIQPDLAVGVTLTGTETLAQGDIFRTLRPVTDVIPFNFYPLDWWSLDWFTVFDLDDIPAYIEEFMDIYGDDPVVITELGCPSAEVNGSSPDYQAECFDVMFDVLRAYPNVRYVTVFTLYDFDEPTCDLFIDAMGLTEAELPPPFFERWRGYICELGILDADYNPKPAWETFIAATTQP